MKEIERLTAEIKEIEQKQKEEEEKQKKINENLKKFNKHVKEQKLEQLQNELEILNQKQRDLKKEIRKIQRSFKTLRFSEEIKENDTYTRRNTPAHEFEDIVEVIGEHKGEELSEKEQWEELNEIEELKNKGFRYPYGRYEELQRLLGIAKEEDSDHEEIYMPTPIPSPELEAVLRTLNELESEKETIVEEIENKEIITEVTIETTNNHEEPEHSESHAQQSTSTNEEQWIEVGPSSYRRPSRADYKQRKYLDLKRKGFFKKPRNIPPEQYTDEHYRTFRLAGYREHKYKDFYFCGCETEAVKAAYKKHKDWTHFTRTYDFHCCKCKRPGPADIIREGYDDYYQLCDSCYKDVTYDETKQWWWHQECPVCLRPMEEKWNINGSYNVCSEECKYAVLAIGGANDFTHIPTRIMSYIKKEKTRADYRDIAAIAEEYYRRTRPNEVLVYDRATYSNQYSWNDMMDYFLEELRQEEETLRRQGSFYRTAEEIQEQEREEQEAREYLEAVQRSWNEHTETIMRRIPKFVNLRNDPRFQGTIKINLCNKCLMVFEDYELVEVDGRLLCKTTEKNEGCYEETSEASSKETSPPKDKGKQIEIKEETSVKNDWEKANERLENDKKWDED